MLLMQPVRLRRLFDAWGLERDPSLWRLRERLRARDPRVMALVGRLSVLLFVGMPIAAFAIAGLLHAGGVSIEWSFVAFIVALIVAVGVTGGVAFGVAVSVAVGVTGGVALGVALGVVEGGAAGGMVSLMAGVMAASVMAGIVSGSVAGAVVSGVVRKITVAMAVIVVLGAAGGVAGGVAFGVLVDVTSAVEVGMAGAMTSILILFRIPFFVAEALWTWGTSLAVRAHPSLATGLARWLPFRHHDLIYLPLPGLRPFLIDLADQNPTLAQALLDEAAESVAQKTPARHALIELQARSLERAARERRWAAAGAFALPFLPSPEDLLESSPLTRFRAAAQDLHAASLTSDHLRRRNALERAAAKLQGFRTTMVGKAHLDELEQRLQSTTPLWLDLLDDALKALSVEERAHPQLPKPFEPGPPLGPADAHLFKGRADLIRLIDHDLADHRRAPLLLTGQRRMGKTSLLRMLPERLGTGSLLVTLNFQKLSGSPHREHPHRWLAEALREARPALPPPPATTAWGDTIAWLEEAESSFGDDRVLIAIDELERIQTGIDEGWGSPVFLDFLRAAGDALRRIRLLLVSAHPLHRLGRAWTDRLISVIHRELTYLLPHEAEDLIRNPMPGFQDIYPPGGVDRIVRETHGHPYLVQLVCDALIRDLNSRSQLVAVDEDLSRAFDRALDDTPLFRELWQDRSDAERALLEALARGGGGAPMEDATLRALLKEGYVERAGEGASLAVPLFGAWIREHA
jgi:uncharacterized protein